MGTTAASGPAPRRPGLALLLVAITSCTAGSSPAVRPPEQPTPAAPDREPREPPKIREAIGESREIRVGLVVGAGSATLGGDLPLVVGLPDGSRIATIPGGETWRVAVAGNQLIVSSHAGWVSPPLYAFTLAAVEPTAPVRVNGRGYRGVAEVLRDRTGLTVVNRVGMEGYLLGVVTAEMGRRSTIELAALRAQAVVSRTYAVRNLGRWRTQGFDLYATVADQVYGGIASESPEARVAVSDTRGRVLTYNGALIEAFFYSTCGGRTAGGAEVFRRAVGPYLRSVSDESPDGSAYCSISPRFHWHEEWTGESLRASLRQNLPREAGVEVRETQSVTDVSITRRTGSGRVDQVVIGLGGSEVRVEGPAIRRVLRGSSGELLWSAAFNLAVTGAGQSVTRLAADGMGAGHGVGFCQWGAVGRARAGQSFEQILAAYYPGTTLERRY